MLSMVIDSISSFMYSKLLVIMLIGTGVYFTIRTKFLQVRLFHSACKAVMETPATASAICSASTRDRSASIGALPPTRGTPRWSRA